jgi:hypothetical protein
LEPVSSGETGSVRPSGWRVSAAGWVYRRRLVTCAKGLKHGDELVRAAQGDAVSAIHLHGLDAEPGTHDAALPLGGEEAIVAGQHEAGRNVGPALKRPRLDHRRRGLRSDVDAGLGAHVDGNIVQEHLERIEVRAD